MKWGRVLAGAVGGGAGAAATLAGKYIDEELTQQRAQALADIQRESSLRTEREMDAQKNTPERLARDRETARQDVLAKARATRESVVEGVNDTAYQGVLDTNNLMETRRRVTAENAVVEGTKGAKLAAEQERIKALTPLETERAAALADIQASRQIRVGNALADAQIRREEARAERALQAKIGPDGKPIKLSEASRLELQDLAKQDQELQKLVDENVASGMLKQDPKDPGWQHFQRRKQALQVQKLRVLAREGVVDGQSAAQDLIGAGSSIAELQASKQQAQLIGGNYAKEFGAAVDSHIKRLQGAPGASAASGAPASQRTAPARQAAPVAPDPIRDAPQGQRLDAAREAEISARMALQKWGRAQQARDPEGFKRAKESALQTEQALRAAEQEWERFVASRQR